MCIEEKSPPILKLEKRLRLEKSSIKWLARDLVSVFSPNSGFFPHSFFSHFNSMQINKTAAQIVCGWKCSTFSKIPNEIQTAAHKTWNKTKVGQSLDPVVVSPIYSTSLLNYIVRTWFVAPLHFRIFSMCSTPFVIIISLTVLRCIFFNRNREILQNRIPFVF